MVARLSLSIFSFLCACNCLFRHPPYPGKIISDLAIQSHSFFPSLNPIDWNNYNLLDSVGWISFSLLVLMIFKAGLKSEELKNVNGLSVIVTIFLGGIAITIFEKFAPINLVVIYFSLASALWRKGK